MSTKVSVIFLLTATFALMALIVFRFAFGYVLVQDEGLSLAKRSNLNFSGSSVVCSDNAGTGTTDCVVTGGAGSGYATIEDEAVPLTQRVTLNFVGAIITCADAAPKTTCTITETSDYDTVENEGAPLAQRATVNFVGAIVDCADVGGKTVCTLTETSDYDTVENEGTPLTQRATVNFVGATIDCVDSAPKTICTLTESSDYDTVENEGIPLTQRGTVNFVGASIDCVDSGGKTVCTISGGGGGDSITVNGVAVTDADFDNSIPAAPSGGTNVKFQQDGGSPANVSAHLFPWDLAFTSTVWKTLTATVNSTLINDWNPTGWNDAQPAQATILLMTSTVDTVGRITGLVGGTEGRLVILFNINPIDSVDSYPVMLYHNNSSSAAANRFMWSANGPVFILPGEAVMFIYSQNRWNGIDDQSVYLKNSFRNWNEYQSATADLNTVTSGTAASCQIGSYLSGNTTSAPVGVFECDTGTTATGRAYQQLGQATDIVPQTNFVFFLTRIAVNDLSDATNRYQIYAGLHDASAGTSVTDGVYFRYQDDVSVNWQICSEDAGTQTCVTTSQAVTTGYWWLGIYIFPTWSKAYFFWGTSGDLINTTPSLATTGGGFNFPESTETNSVSVGINKTVGTTQQNLYIDLIAWRTNDRRD